MISVSCIQRAGYDVLFCNGMCKVMNKNEIILSANLSKNGIYKLKVLNNLNINVCNNMSTEVSSNVAVENIMLWHRRLGHLNSDYMNKLKNSAATGINFKGELPKVCKHCVFGKMTKKPFLASESRASEKLALVHSDLCEVTPNSLGNARYILTFIDDFSRKIFLYFLKRKSDVAINFKHFKYYIENETNLKIKVLRSDNGREYLNQVLGSFLLDNGIKHETSVPDNPQQNGRAERVNRILLDKAKCMLSESGMEKVFWAEAVATSAYLANRMPKKCLNWKTPEEVWTGQRPDLGNLRVFGCDALGYVPKKKRGKVDRTAVECKMLGYASSQKGYRLWNPVMKKVIVSRDVSFLEDYYENKPTQVNNFDSKSLVFLPLNDESVQEDISTEMPNFYENESTTESEEENVLDQGKETQVIQNESSNFNENQSQEAKSLRRSNRKTQSKLPGKYREFDMKGLPGHKNLYLCTTEEDSESVFMDQYNEPESFKDAINSSESSFWVEAMQHEYDTIIKNNTWELCKLPFGRTPVTNKWVYKRKMSIDGKTKYKARLVARGFSQQAGIDYFETYSPVVRFTSLRLLIAYSVQNDLEIFHLDVDSAFLHGELEEEIYMTQPEGFIQPGHEDDVCELKKALYGLKQGGRAWHSKINSVLIAIGLTQS